MDVLRYERDQAQASARRWQRLYEVEARQRQKETDVSEQTIQGLRTEIQRLCQFSPNGTSDQSAYLPGQSRGDAPSVQHLRHQIIELMAERDRLFQALEQEQQNHSKTRETLISALGDALETQNSKKYPALPSSQAGARANAIILKDRDSRRKRQ